MATHYAESYPWDGEHGRVKLNPIFPVERRLLSQFPEGCSLKFRLRIIKAIPSLLHEGHVCPSHRYSANFNTDKKRHTSFIVTFNQKSFCFNRYIGY